MSSLSSVTAATAAPPVENWGAIRWATRNTTNEPSGVKHERSDDNNEAAGGSNVSNEEAVLQLVSLLKPQHISSGAPASAVEKPILQIPVASVATASATTKNDLTLTLRPQSSVTQASTGSAASVPLELTSVRFAIPNVCVGHEQTEEAGREILAEVQERLRAFQSRAAPGGPMGPRAGREDERVLAVLDDLTFSYPSGRYKLIVSNGALTLEDKRRAGGTIGSVPLSDVVQLYLCDIPTVSGAVGEQMDTADLAQYVVVILRNPLKVRTTTYNHLVISCPAGFALDEAHPWRSELDTQEAIDGILAALPHNANVKSENKQEEKSLKNTFPPTMSGRVSEILIRVLKAVTGASALGGRNKEYQSTQLGSGYHSVLRCLHHGSEGLLFVLNSALLFLHRPVTRALYSDITRVELDESESGTATFQIVVYGSFGISRRSGEDKLVFSALDKKEKTGLLAYLERKTTVKRIGIAEDDDDDEEDEEDDEEEDDDEEDDEDDDFDDDGEDEDDDEGEDDRKHRKRQRSKEEKSKKKHKDRKHKKHRSEHHGEEGEREHKHKHKHKHKKDKKDKKDKDRKKHESKED